MPTRLVVDMSTEEHRAIKMQAFMNDLSISSYIKSLVDKDKAQNPVKVIKESGSREV